MRQVHSDRGASAVTGALRRRSLLASTVSMLVLALMGCSNSMQTSNGTPPGRLTISVADAALTAGVPDMALRVADLILRDNPRNVAALVAKGDALYAMGRPDLARTAYRAAVAADPASVPALVGLGRTLVRSDPKAAEAAFLDAATRAPDNVTALSNLGIARDLQGRHETAQAAYRQALAVVPDMADVQLNLGLSLALSGKSGEAVAVLRPLAGQIDQAGVRRNDLAAALALAGDQVEAGLVQRGEARVADTESAPAATPPAPAPLVAIANPVGVRVAPAVEVPVAPQTVMMPQAAVVPPPAVVPALAVVPASAAVPAPAVAPLLDVRPAPVVPVMEVANVGAPIGPATKAVFAPGAPQAAVRHALRHDADAYDRPAVIATATPPAAATNTPVAGAMDVRPAAATGAPPAAATMTPVAAVMDVRQGASMDAPPGAATSAPVIVAMDARPVAPAGATPAAATMTPAAAATVAPPAAAATTPAAVAMDVRPAAPTAVPPAGAVRTPVAVAMDVHPAAPTGVPQAGVHRIALGHLRSARTVPEAPTTPASAAVALPRIAPAPAAEGRNAASDHPAERACQLAALDTEQRARLEWQHLQARMPELLSGRTPVIMQAEVHGRTFWRLRTGGFRTASEQSAFCAQVRGLGLDCWQD